MYSTTELSNLTGYTKSTISNILKRHNVKEIETGFKGVKYWDESCLEIIRNERNKQLKETITIATLSSMSNIPLSELNYCLVKNRTDSEFTKLYTQMIQNFLPSQNYVVLQKHF